jgi:hypothetical protein
MKTVSIASFILFFGSPLAQAAEEPYPLTGTYSDLTCIEEEGDVVGTEITILPAFQDASYRYYALVQFAEGVAGMPQLVPATVNENRISFKVNYFGQPGAEFTASIDKAGLTGGFAKPLGITVELPRKRSFWDEPGDLCL